MKSSRWYAPLLCASIIGVTAACGATADDTGGQGSLTIKPDVLTVSTITGDAPMSDTENGKPAGLEIDLTEALAKQLGYKRVDWVTVDFASQIPGIAARKFDVASGGITGWAPKNGAALKVVKERTKQVSFSRPYSLYYIRIITNSEEHPGLTKVSQIESGMKVGVAQGTHMQLWADKVLAPQGVKVVGMDQNQVWTQLKAGTVDVGLNTEAALASVLKTHPEFREGQRVPALTGGLCFAFDPDNVKLRKKFDKALGQLIENGTYKDIYSQYFPEKEPPKLPANSYTHE